MSLKYFISAFLLLAAFSLNAQGDSPAIENPTHEINLANLSEVNQFAFISKYIKDVELLGLGEASHGTQEFYLAKCALTKYLIQNLNFSTISFEIDEDVASKINNYVHGESEDISKILQNYGLYNARELRDLFEWIRDYNAKQIKSSAKIDIIGFDSENYWADPFTRDSLMAGNLLSKPKDGKCIVWAHNSHLLKSNTWDVTQSEIKAMGNYLSDRMGDKFYLVAFDTDEGELTTIEDGVLQRSEFKMDKKILDYKVSNYFIAFDKSVTPISYSLTHLSSNRQGNPQLSPARLGIDIDALFFIQKTSASIPIK